MSLNDAKSVAKQLTNERQLINKGKRDIVEAERLLKLQEKIRKAYPPINVKIGDNKIQDNKIQDNKIQDIAIIIIIFLLLIILSFNMGFTISGILKKTIIEQEIVIIEKPVAIPTNIYNYLTQEVSLKNLTEKCFLIENEIDKTKGFYCR